MPTSPRVRYKRCGVKRNPPVTASPCQPPLGKGAKGTGEADCHSQCAHWPRNDREFYIGCGGCPGGRGNRRSAASGGCSEAISRKCPDWQPQQWPGIGWHDGGQENPAPTDSLVAGTAGRCRHRPLRNRIMGCVGEELCPSRGRGRTPPLRKRYMKCSADKGRPGGPPLRFSYPLFIYTLRRFAKNQSPRGRGLPV